jgi:hypothetical protein
MGDDGADDEQLRVHSHRWMMGFVNTNLDFAARGSASAAARGARRVISSSVRRH